MERIYRNRNQRLVYPENVTSDVNVTTTSRTCSKGSGSSELSGEQHIIESAVEEENDTVFLEDDIQEERKEDAETREENNESNGSVSEKNSRYDSKGSQLIRERIRHLARAFSERALRVRRRFDFPPTPSTVSSDPEDGNHVYPSPSRRRDQIVKWMSEEWGSTVSMCDSIRMKIKKLNPVIEPQSYFYVGWLCMVMAAYLYNCFTIPLRITFPYQTEGNTFTWFLFDCSMDAIYFLDAILIKPRIMYLDDGFWVRNLKLTRKNYTNKTQFKMDILSLTPIDLLSLKFGIGQPLLRLQRLLKVQTFWEFFDYFDNVMSSPYVMRVARSLTYMIYLVHLNACAYYAVSVKEGLGINSWVFNGQGNAYIRCFYFATKTATSIGKNPRPENELEYLFMTGCWLMGVFVFALLIGQIRDIIATATRSQTEYRKRVDETLNYLRRLNLPPKLIERVKTWFSFTWQQQHTLDESHILDNLPHKMKTDVAINVHINTLNKVQLFQNCDEALLRELVLKLRPVLYLPGDYICRKGEVGKEMYIVKTGQVQVVSGSDGSVLATLTEGSVFGEISLLSLSGGNRRTADVKSHGFSNLFVLSKDDLNEALVFYPNAQEILKKKAKQLMRQNAARERRDEAEVVIGNVEPAAKIPRLLPIVMKVLPPDSKSARLLKYGSRRSTRTYEFNRSRNKNSGSFTSNTTKRATRSHSVDLGNLDAYTTYNRVATKEEPANTFQCHVTVHREMSK